MVKKKRVIVVCLFSFSTMDASFLALLLEASDDSGFEAIEQLGTFSDGSSESIIPIISSCCTDCPKELFIHRIEGFYKNDIPRYNDPTWRTDNTMDKDTKAVMRIRKSKDRQYNGQKKRDEQRSTKHTHKTKDRVTRTPSKTESELRCSARVSSSCSTSGTRRVNLVKYRSWYKEYQGTFL